MRVLLTYRPSGAFGYISDAWINCFRSIGCAAERWDGSYQSWQAFQPDLYIGCSGHKQSIMPQRDRHAKVAIHVNPYGPTSIKNIDESRDNIGWVKGQCPDVVFGYGHASDEKQFWSYWVEKCGIPWVSMGTAADVTLFNMLPGEKQYDLAWVGGRWPYKAIRLDRWLMPILTSAGLSYHLYGDGYWPGVKVLPLRHDPLSEKLVCKVLNSGRIGPCVNEPHAAEFGIDVSERTFKVAMSGALVVHDKVKGLERWMPDAIVGDDPEHFMALCCYYARAGASVINPIIMKQRAWVLAGQTYHHRLSNLLLTLGFSSVAGEMQNYIGQLK